MGVEPAVYVPSLDLAVRQAPEDEAVLSPLWRPMRDPLLGWRVGSLVLDPLRDKGEWRLSARWTSQAAMFLLTMQTTLSGFSSSGPLRELAGTLLRADEPEAEAAPVALVLA